ncbi:hypothetical protein D3C78_994250 [compost metagenome]
MAILNLLASLLVFAGILAGCMAALLLVIMLLRFPLLLIAVVLACWVFSRLLETAGEPPD